MRGKCRNKVKREQREQRLRLRENFGQILKEDAVQNAKREHRIWWPGQVVGEG